jgi:hypothetical protein
MHQIYLAIDESKSLLLLECTRYSKL